MRFLNKVSLVLLLSSILTGVCFAYDVIEEKYQMELLTIDGEINTLLSAETSTFVYFTGLGCPYCHAFEENVMQELFGYLTQNKGIDVAVVVYGDPHEVGDKYRMASYPVFLGKKDVWDAYDLRGVPSFFLISSEEIIEWSMVGFPLDGDIDDFLSLRLHLEQK